MKAIKFSRNELRVIDACLIMTGGNEINQFITDAPKLSEAQTYSLSISINEKIQKVIKQQKNG